MIANDLFDKMDLNRDDKVTFEEFTTVAKTDPFILDILNPKAWTINKNVYRPTYNLIWLVTNVLLDIYPECNYIWINLFSSCRTDI